MIGRLRLLIVLARPAVLMLLGLFAATGMAQAGHPGDSVLLAKVLVAVVGFLVFSVVVNDLADEAIDRINLPGDPRRPLAAGATTRREFLVVGVTAGAVALTASALLHWPAIVVVASGLLLSAGYSLRPVRLADRGAIASLLLPAGYVAVPYLVGIFSVRGAPRVVDLVLLGGLYVGFIGRIVLKDFRDVRGDALFGKRTFLIRHGRRWTCGFSAGCWIAGAITLAAVRGLTPTLACAYLTYVVVALGLLRALSVERGTRRDEALISAVAIVGRGMMVTLLAHFSITAARWPAAGYQLVVGVLVLIVLGQAWTMVRHGPVTRLTVPLQPAGRMSTRAPVAAAVSAAELCAAHASVRAARPRRSLVGRP
jgi:4-hydroxybenzoate polyprenyltransferase